MTKEKTEAQGEQNETTENKTILGTTTAEKEKDANFEGFDSETGSDKEKVDDIEKETKKEKPEDLDEKYWDVEKNEFKTDELLTDLEKAKKNALDLRKKLSQKGAKVKDAKEYKLKEADEILEIVPSDSETMKVLKESAFESGMDNGQFNTFLKKIIPELQEKGILKTKEAELTPEQQEAEFKEFKENEIKKLGENGQNVIQSLSNWGSGLVNKGVLSIEDKTVFDNMGYDADSIRVLMKLRAISGEPSIPIKTNVPNSMKSEDEIKSLMMSDKYKAGDPATVRTVKEWYKIAYKGNQSS